MFSKRKVAALVAEFLGTAALALVVLTVSRSQIGIPYFVGIAAGVTVLLFGLAMTRDVQLNPAYTFALWTARRIKFLKMVAFIAAQFLGGMAAYMLYKTTFAEGGLVQPLPSEYRSELLVAEALGAFIFSFAAAGALYRQNSQLVRNVVTGLAYTVGVIMASVVTLGGFINPAVAGASNGWTWTYVFGPVLGAVIGVNLYSLLFADRQSARSGAANAAKKPVSVRDNSEVSSAKVEDKPVAKTEKTDKKKSSKKSKK